MNWLGEIPSHWEIKRIATCFSENNELNTDSSEENALQFKYGNIVGKPKIKPDDELMETFQRYTLVRVNDIIINGLNLNYDFVTQRVAIVREKGIITSAYISIRPSNGINPFYYCYLFKSMDAMKVFNGMGVGIRRTLSYSELKQVKIPIPLIEEQNRIVAFLDDKCEQIDKTITQKERSIALLNEKKRTLIQYAVLRGIDRDCQLKYSGIDWIGDIPKHWEIRRLKTFCDFVNRGCTPSYVEESDYKVVNQATFSKGYWDETDIRFTNNNDKHGVLWPDDILLASTGGGVLGKVCKFTQTLGVYIADSHVTIIRDSLKRFSPDYLVYLLSVNYDLINGILAQGSTNQIELQRNWLSNLRLPFPDLDEQQIIVSHLDSLSEDINRAIELKRQEIEKLKEYRSILISSAVTGKIKID